MINRIFVLEMIPIRQIARSTRFSSSLPSEKPPQRVQFKALRLPYIQNRVAPPGKEPPVTFFGKPREIPPDADWTAIWPAAQSFQPELFKIPIRQGYTEKGPPKYTKDCSIELLKIPNFLHLSPVAIKKHCAALKKFCTTWPEELKSRNACRKHFPLEVITSDYCRASPSIRNPLARIATITVKLRSLQLDAHAKDKFLRLVGDRYNPKTDTVTITSDKCPCKKQNLDYVKYLLTALYHESKSVELWESEKSVEDMEYYEWEKSKHRKSLEALLQWSNKESPDTKRDANPCDIPSVSQYTTALSAMINNGEDRDTIAQYKEAVKHLLNLTTNEK